MVKPVTITDFKWKLLQHKKGKMIALTPNTLPTDLLQATDPIKLQCTVCLFEQTKIVKEINAKTTCPKCTERLTKPKFNRQRRAFAQYMLNHLKFSEAQICALFDIHKKQIEHLFKKTPPLDYLRNHLVILSLDPATVNFGCAVLKVYGSSTIAKVKIVESRMLINTFISLNNLDFDDKIDRVIRELDDMVSQYKPDILIMERFQSRGFSSNSNELVNIFLGSVLGHFKTTKTIPLLQIVTPSGWKKRVNMIFDLKAAYKKLTKIITPHQLDAALLGLSVFPTKNAFTWLADEAARQKFYQKIRKATWQLR